MRQRPAEGEQSTSASNRVNGNRADDGQSGKLSRRNVLGLAGAASLALFSGLGSAQPAEQQTPVRRPRIACLVSYWGLPTSHADWIVNKLLDGYWWQGAHTVPQVEVVAVYIHQFDTSLLGQKVCRAKGIPIFKTVGEAVTLGGKELAVDGVVMVCEHGNYPTDLKGHWLLPRWWIFQQVVQVFETSKRSVPIFNDKHLSYSWDDAKWMYDKSRELGFPLTGGSSIPTFFRKPELDLAVDTPLRNALVVGAAPDEGAIFHCIDVLQAFADRRSGGESGVRSVQSIRGPEAWTWVESTPWAAKLLVAVREEFRLSEAELRAVQKPAVCIVKYNDGTNAAVVSGAGVGWTFAGEIAGVSKPTIISMLDWPGPVSQYHAANAFVRWVCEMMRTGKEPFPAERLLLSTGITNQYMESNWQNGRYSEVGRVVETPMLAVRYRSSHGPLFERGARPPNTPYLRGFTA